MTARAARRHGPRTLAVGLVALVGILGAPVASAHFPADGVQADHAYAADPLFTMSAANSLFPGHNPDGLTAMASTTKVMTLVVTLDALKAHVVSLGDVVTVSFNASAQPAGSSMMVDDKGALLAAGEQMTLEDLIFGMMIPSGNNATVAIAEHVARRYYGSAGTVAMFVNLMNTKAVSLGLVQTIYSNPVGYANGIQQTSARDLARLWKAGMADPEFRRIVAPQTWVAHGTLAGKPKTYTLERVFGYPGLEGYKNGRNTPCSGDQDECFVGSAARISRRIIVSGMQADGWVGGSTGDAAEMFDAAFARLFHPDPRGASPLGKAATRTSLVCPTAGRAVTASMPGVGRVQVSSWSVDLTAQTYSIAGTTTAATGLATTSTSTGRDVDAIALSSTRVVTATRVGSSFELRLWNIPASGAPSLVGSVVSPRTAGVGKSIELVRLSSTMFASAAVTSTNALSLKVWRSSSTGLTLLTSSSPTSSVASLDVASNPGQAMRFVVLANSSAIGGQPSVRTYDVNASTGAVTARGAQDFGGGAGTSIVAAPVLRVPGEVTADAFYAIAQRASDGSLGVFYARVRSNGTLGGYSGVATIAGSYTDVELAGFGSSGVVAITRLANGTSRQTVWESYRHPVAADNPGGNVVPLQIANHATSTTGLEPEVCALPTSKAEGDFVTSLREGLGAIIRLRGFRVGDR